MAWLNKTLSVIIGNAAERRAQKHLQSAGLQFIERNYRCKAGEIDLIMTQDSQLVFVEVKYRSRSHFGRAAEFLHEAKRRKLIRAINYYLHTRQLNPAHINYRLDLVAIDQHHIQWFKQV